MERRARTAKHILIVDDEPKVAFFLGKALERSNQNYCVTVAQSGEEALELLVDSAVDVLVTDLRMPGISGLELIRWARASSPQTRSILITAYGSDEVEAETRRLEASRYITKPFDIEELVQAVQEAVRPSTAERALAGEQRLRDLLVSLVFHQLRVPLTYMMSYAAVLVQESEEEHKGLAETILRCTSQMRDALADFTLLAEWSVGQMPGYLQRLNLHQALETTAAQLASLAVTRRQTIEITPASEPITITTDALLLGVLLTGLISSAMKRVRVDGQIRLSATREGTMAVVTVRGSSDPTSAGPTLPSELDVCLTVTQELAEALGGELQVENEVGEDVLFRLLFPIGS